MAHESELYIIHDKALHQCILFYGTEQGNVREGRLIKVAGDYGSNPIRVSFGKGIESLKDMRLRLDKIIELVEKEGS